MSKQASTIRPLDSVLRQHGVSRVAKELAAIHGTNIAVGANGTFFGGLPGEPVKQATGEITRILEGPNYALITVKQEDGTTTMLRR